MSGRPMVLRGWHVLATMLGFFGLVIAINIAFAVAAIRTFPGEDVTHPYIQGLNYNMTVAERRAQRELGWGAAAAFYRTNEGAVLEVDLRTRDDAPLTGANLEGALRWPTDAARDRALTFEELGQGRYRARLGALSEGRWQLRAHAARGHDSLDFDSELIWPTAP